MKPESRYRLLAAGLSIGVCGGVGSCGGSNSSTTDGGTHDANTDSDSNTNSVVAAIESALDSPEDTFTFGVESSGFGDSAVSALASRVPAPPPLSETPSAGGWTSDSIDTLPAVSELLADRSHDVFVVQLAITGIDDAPSSVTGGLTSSVGAVLGRRVWDAETGDRLVPRTMPLLPGIKTRSFELSVSSSDTDRLQLLVAAATTPTLTLTVGDADIPIDLTDAAVSPSLFTIDGDGSAHVNVAVTVIKNPRGPCVVTEAVLKTEAFAGSKGPVAIVRGALRRDGQHVGFLRGYFGRAPTSDQDVLVFKTIDLTGQPLALGVRHGALGYAPSVGKLHNLTADLGSFLAKGAVSTSDDEIAVNLALSLHTECRN